LPGSLGGQLLGSAGPVAADPVHDRPVARFVDEVGSSPSGLDVRDNPRLGAVDELTALRVEAPHR
jgi:hypothetical protein